MIDTRTESMIRLYMQWSPAGALTPEDFLRFRRQAVEEELAGIRETPFPLPMEESPAAGRTAPMPGAQKPAGYAPPPMEATAGRPEEKKAGKPQAAGKLQETEKQADRPPAGQAPAGAQKNKPRDAGPSGMTDADFLAFMQSVED